MSKQNILTEWAPNEGFNILDYRDFINFPQYENPPFILKFRFSMIQNPIEYTGIGVDLMGWNIPECQTDTLFSKIQVSKNGFQDIYYNQPGGKMGENHLTLNFKKNMVLKSPNDVLFISFFPLCPVHMVDIARVVFLVDAVVDPIEIIPTTIPPVVLEEKKKLQQELFNPQPMDHFWYIYATIFVMILLLMISLLFMTINQRKKRYIIIRAKK